jgi:hypothetical protein
MYLIFQNDTLVTWCITMERAIEIIMKSKDKTGLIIPYTIT